MFIELDFTEYQPKVKGQVEEQDQIRLE